MKFEDYIPMLALPMNMDKLDKYKNYTMEVKLDGVRCIAMKTFDGNVTMYTRSGHELHHKLPHIRQQLSTISGQWVIDGEVGYVNTLLSGGIPVEMDFNATMRVLGSGVEEALQKQVDNTNQGRPIKFVVFDALHFGNARIADTYDLAARQVVLYTIVNSAHLYDVQVSFTWEKWNEFTYDRIVGQAGEGVMLKNPQSKYFTGKRRANTWYKVKAFDSFDGWIESYVEGKGKYGGQVGAVSVIDATGTKVNVSGMDDSQRADMTVNFNKKYRGKHVEIKHFGRIGKDKKGYRHPQFLRMRPDLDNT